MEFLFDLVPHIKGVLKGYSWLCAEECPQAILSGSYVVPEIQTGVSMM